MILIFRGIVESRKILYNFVKNGGHLKTEFANLISTQTEWEFIYYNDQEIPYRYYYNKRSNTLISHWDNPDRNEKIEKHILNIEVTQTE